MSNSDNFFNLQHRLVLKIKKLATNGKIIPIIGLKILIYGIKAIAIALVYKNMRIQK